MTDTLLTRFGQKAVITDEGVVEGWLAPFGGPVKGGFDLDGETFTPKTDFALDYYPSIPILYAHGRDPEVGAAKVGEITVKEIRDKGLWVQGQLYKQEEYYGALRELADKGDLYWSSGAIAHLVDKDTKSGAIKSWPVAEATLTLTPANPDAHATVKEAVVIDGDGAISPPNEAYVPATPTDLGDVSKNVNPWTFVVAKEGRRHSTSDKARLAELRRIHAEMARYIEELDPADFDEPPTDTPAPDEAAGKALDTPPVYVLTVKAGDDAERPTPDLVSLSEKLADVAVKEARRLIG